MLSFSIFEEISIIGLHIAIIFLILNSGGGNNNLILGWNGLLKEYVMKKGI